MRKTIMLALFAITISLILAGVSALEVSSAGSTSLQPGEEGTLNIEIDNILDDDVTDISIRLDFTGLQFIPVGTSEQSIDEIQEGEEEDFTFIIKAAAGITPGDYEIPYVITYTFNNDQLSKSGTIGVVVSSDPELVFSVNTENPIIGREGTITLRIVNKGFYDARFVSIKALPEGFTLLSDNEIYIGTVDSDDFETAAFDVIYNNVGADFNAIVEYRDFSNKQITKTVNIPLTIYSEERALELGLIQRSNISIYISIAVLIIILIILWRVFRKRRRLRRSAKNNNE